MDEKLEKYLSGRNLTILCIVLFLIITFFIITAIADLSKDKKKEEKKKEQEQIELVTNASRFYTVSGCIDKYLLYVSEKDTEKILDVLDKDYIKNNSITKENVLSFSPSLSGTYTMNARKMYQESLSNAIIKYYVYGQMEKNQFLEIGTEEKQDAYFIVTLDTSKLTFSIAPYDGKIFK